MADIRLQLSTSHKAELSDPLVLEQNILLLGFVNDHHTDNVQVSANNHICGKPLLELKACKVTGCSCEF